MSVSAVIVRSWTTKTPRQRPARNCGSITGTTVLTRSPSGSRAQSQPLRTCGISSFSTRPSSSPGQAAVISHAYLHAVSGPGNRGDDLGEGIEGGLVAVDRQFHLQATGLQLQADDVLERDLLPLVPRAQARAAGRCGRSAARWPGQQSGPGRRRPETSSQVRVGVVRRPGAGR